MNPNPNPNPSPSSNPNQVDPRTNGTVAYSSASPDEEALCRAAAFFGICFTERTTAELQVQMPSAARPERWLLLNVLEFTSDRKRMSVIVKDASSGRIRIYIKVGPHLPHISRISPHVSRTSPAYLPHISP